MGFTAGNEYIEVDQGKIDAVVDYIDQHYDEYTRNKKFNAMLACSTILEAISYYETFKKNTQLKCAIVYTSNKSDYTKNRETSLKSYNFLLKIIQEYKIGGIILYRKHFLKYKDLLKLINDLKELKPDYDVYEQYRNLIPKYEGKSVDYVDKGCNVAIAMPTKVRENDFVYKLVERTIDD